MTAFFGTKQLFSHTKQLLLQQTQLARHYIQYTVSALSLSMNWPGKWSSQSVEPSRPILQLETVGISQTWVDIVCVTSVRVQSFVQLEKPKKTGSRLNWLQTEGFSGYHVWKAAISSRKNTVMCCCSCQFLTIFLGINNLCRTLLSCGCFHLSVEQQSSLLLKLYWCFPHAQM